MPTKEPAEGKCGAKIRDHRVPDEWDQDVGYCKNKAGFRTDHVGDGRCYLHGGVVKEDDGRGRPIEHGMYAKRQNYYKECDDAEQRWIDSVAESLLDDAPFGPDSFAKMQMIRNIAIDMHKLQSANDYIDDVGLVHKDKTVGYTDDGRPIKQDEENVLNVSYDRLNRTMTRQLKELGILEDPDSQQAAAQENIASELSELRKARDNVSDDA